MSEKKRNKLVISELSSVDLTKRGANQDSHICLYKSAAESPPAESPDTLTPEDVSIVKRLFNLFSAAFKPLSDAEKSAENVAKDARSFSAVSAEREVNENLWRYTDALMTSFRSVVEDTELDTEQRQALLLESLGQFTATMTGFIPALAGVVKSAGEDPGTPETDTINKGDDEMNFKDIDATTLSEQDKQDIIELAKKCGMEVPTPAPATEPAPAPATEPPAVEKSAADPALLAAIEELKKSNAALLEREEKREMLEVAKKYAAPLGKKEDELVDTLLALKKSGEANYNAYVAVLEEQVAFVNKSGLFSEIGKSGSNPVVTYGDVDDAFAKSEAIAKNLMQEKGISYEEALSEAWRNNPDLADLCASMS